MPLTDIQKVSKSVTKVNRKLNRITTSVQKLQGRFPQVFTEQKKITDSLDDLTRLAESTHKFQATVELVDAIGESMDGILEAIAASERGDTFGVATHSLGSVATLIKGSSSAALMFGPEMLPVAVIGFIVGSIIDGVARIVEFFAPEEKSLLERIEQLIRKVEAENRFNHLQSAFEEIVKLEATFEAPGGSWERAGWAAYASKMDVALGNARHHLGEVAAWLENGGNQKLQEDWTAVLEVYVACHVSLFLLLLRTYARAQQTALEIRGGLGSTEMTAETFAAVTGLVAEQLTAVAECKSYFQTLLVHLDNLAWPARNMARLFSIGTNEQLYSARGCIVAEREDDWTGHGGEHDDFMFVDGEEDPTVLAWHADGGDAETLEQGEWRKFRGISAGRRSVDAVAVGEDLACVTCREGKTGVVIHTARVTRNGLPRDLSQSTLRVPSSIRIDGVVRGFVSAADEGDEDGEDVVRVAFLGEDRQVYASRGPKGQETLGQLGKRIDWCQKIFARDGRVWAMGAHDVAWLPYDAASTASWKKVSPNARSVGLDGRWDFIYLDPPGPDGMMVGTLVHQLLFWTEETGWRKGNEDESHITFSLARHAPHPVCVEMLELRRAVQESLDLMEKEAVREVMDLLPDAVPLAALA